MRISRDARDTPPRVQHFSAFHIIGGCGDLAYILLTGVCVCVTKYTTPKRYELGVCLVYETINSDTQKDKATQHSTTHNLRQLFSKENELHSVEPTTL